VTDRLRIFPTMLLSPTSGSQEAELSDYEKLRLEKIKRNEDRMKELGLFKTRDKLAASAKKKKGSKKKTPQVSPELAQRRSSRKRSSVVNYSHEQVIPMFEDDEEKANNEDAYDSDEDSALDDKEDDYESNDDDDDDDEDDEMEEPPPKKRSKPTYPNKVASSDQSRKKTAVDTSYECVNPKGGLTLEYAKTGRSTCRKCKNKIEKGAPRIGMEAWIVGRNAMTWQRPKCLLQNMCCLYEKSGKGKCKVSHIPFEKGQLKIGIRCHTATSYYRIEAIGGVLSNVVSLMRTEEGAENFELTVDDIDGNEKLKEEDRQTLESVLKNVFSQNSDAKIGEKMESSVPDTKIVKQKTQVKQEKRLVRDRDQPKVGAKTGAKGKVQWKFGGRSCYGTLIPRMETKTHCYARTHKGNVKTLAKGKDYWSMLE